MPRLVGGGVVNGVQVCAEQARHCIHQSQPLRVSTKEEQRGIADKSFFNSFNAYARMRWQSYILSIWEEPGPELGTRWARDGGITPDPRPPLALGERKVQFLHPVVAHHLRKRLGKDAIVMDCVWVQGKKTAESRKSCVKGVSFDPAVLLHDALMVGLVVVFYDRPNIQVHCLVWVIWTGVLESN